MSHRHIRPIYQGWEPGLRWTRADRHLRRGSDAGSHVRRDVVHLADISFMYACFFSFSCRACRLTRGAFPRGHRPLDLANAPRYGGRSLMFYREAHTKRGLAGEHTRPGRRAEGGGMGMEHCAAAGGAIQAEPSADGCLNLTRRSIRAGYGNAV
ncbi:hypothetical protein LX36DRAFT_457323 [Colletotrichum falcatum]|nr:hypothetical protein LX36DRAFT_457323 [Colletotrichum falcatum]